MAIKTTKKEKLIEKIKDIIVKMGATNSAEMQLDSSPLYSSAGNSCSLVEKFNYKTVDIVTYNKDIETFEFTLPYEELKTSLLEEIQLRLKSCADENGTKTFLFIEKNGSGIITLSAKDYDEAEEELKEKVKYQDEWRCENEDGEDE